MSKFIFLISLLVSAFAAAAPSETRIQEIKNLADSFNKETLVKGITFKQDAGYEGLAIAYKNEGEYIVIVNPQEFGKLTNSMRNLVMFHEIGHIRLGHSDMDPALKVRLEVELEADYFSAFIYKNLSQVDENLKKFLDWMEAEQTNTVPSGAQRAEIYRKILFP